MTSVRIQRRHLAALKYCARGSRAFFARQGLSWSDFLRNGIDSQTFRNTGDAMAIKAAELAEAEVARGR